MMLSLAGVAEPPSAPTLVYYNARLALREHQATEALRLWLVRNALKSVTGEVSEHDEDFRSLTWVAAGDRGICQDSLRLDTEGAGLWPLALHNWFIREMRRGEPRERPAPFGAFQVPQQQRFISLKDILGSQELRTVRFYRTNCYRMKDVLVGAGESYFADTTDRTVQTKVLTFLLETSLRSLDTERVTGRSTITARLLDIRLKRMDLLQRRAKRDYRRKRTQIKELGASIEPPKDIAKSKDIINLLSVTAGWQVDDWMALEAARRLYLYDWVRRSAPASPQRQAVELSLIDRLMDDGDGKELNAWIAFMGTTEATKRLIWSGDRGQRLLGLQAKTGFRERSSIALHRGVDAVGSGFLPEALRAFAYALHFANESKDAEQIRRLSLRWLSFVARSFEVSHELLTMLVALVPRGDLSQVLEDLAWEAALSADLASFDRTVAAYRGRGALRRRIHQLRPLAQGDGGAFFTQIRDEFEDSPHVTLRFIRRYLERIETQDAEIRSNHRDSLRDLRALLARQAELLGGGLGRNADKLERHCSALLEGLPEANPGDSARDRAQGLAPGTEVFAGSIRLAPSDPLPWPFPLPSVRAPSVFKPLNITPVEWPSPSGLIMGWKLGQ